MTIIFNELNHAKKLLQDCTEDKKEYENYFDWKDCLILSKYFRHELGLKPQKIKERILEYFENKGIQYNDVRMSDSLQRAIKRSKLQQLRIVESVTIRENEFTAIRSVRNFNLEKIIFVMLVLAKAIRKSSNYNGKEYILTWKFSNILRLAKLYINKSEADQYKHKLHKLNMISSLEPGRKKLQKGVESFRILFAETNDSPSPIKITVDNLDDIISFYPFHCLECGKTIDQTGNRKKYCSDCANKIKILQSP